MSNQTETRCADCGAITFHNEDGSSVSTCDYRKCPKAFYAAFPDGRPRGVTTSYKVGSR